MLGLCSEFSYRARRANCKKTVMPRVLFAWGLFKDSGPMPESFFAEYEGGVERFLVIDRIALRNALFIMMGVYNICRKKEPPYGGS